MENNENNYLFELIQELQSKLGDEKNPNTNEDKINTDYVQESMFNNSNKKDNNNFNISDIFNNLNLSSLLGNNDSGFDINSIMKFQKILSAMNKDDPRKNLLISLKPFLRKSRQEKINEYLTYLTIGNALGIFDDKGSGKDDTQ